MRSDTAALIVNGIEGVITSKTVIYVFERLMDGAALLKSPEFEKTIVEPMK